MVTSEPYNSTYPEMGSGYGPTLYTPCDGVWLWPHSLHTQRWGLAMAPLSTYPEMGSGYGPLSTYPEMEPDYDPTLYLPWDRVWLWPHFLPTLRWGLAMAPLSTYPEMGSGHGPTLYLPWDGVWLWPHSLPTLRWGLAMAPLVAIISLVGVRTCSLSANSTKACLVSGHFNTVPTNKQSLIDEIVFN
jgi:hypothetical protein